MNKSKFALLAASLVLAIVFISCSSDDGGEKNLIQCRIDSACVEVSADDCLELDGQKVQSSEEESIAGSSSSSDESLVSSSSSFETVEIGEQTWMKKNLDVEVTGSKCYDDDPDNCEIYGRLYDWATAMNLPSSCNNASCEEQIDTPHRGICPDGWHIPTDEEWGVLVEYAGGSSIAGGKLKAEAGWNNDGNGTDDYDFSALPGGYGFSGGSFYDVGYYGYWWSASEYDGANAYTRSMYYYNQSVNRHNYDKTLLQSVRCLRD